MYVLTVIGGNFASTQKLQTQLQRIRCEMLSTGTRPSRFSAAGAAGPICRAPHSQCHVAETRQHRMHPTLYDGRGRATVHHGPMNRTSRTVSQLQQL